MATCIVCNAPIVGRAIVVDAESAGDGQRNLCACERCAAGYVRWQRWNARRGTPVSRPAPRREAA